MKGSPEVTSSRFVYFSPSSFNFRSTVMEVVSGKSGGIFQELVEGNKFWNDFFNIKSKYLLSDPCWILWRTEKKLLKFTPSFWERAQNKTENEIHSRSQYLIVWFKFLSCVKSCISGTRGSWDRRTTWPLVCMVTKLSFIVIKIMLKQKIQFP